MPKITRIPKKVVSLYPDPELKILLEKQAKSKSVSMNEYCLNLITRGLLAEDVETVRADIQSMCQKINLNSGLRKKEQLILLEMLAYMRLFFSNENPEKLEKAKTFAQRMVTELEEETL